MIQEMILKYDGNNINGQMDSYLVARSIISFTDFIIVASKQVYGEAIALNTKVMGFERGSFDIKFWLEIAGATQTFLTSNGHTINDLAEIMKGCMALFKHLRGEPPREVTRENNGVKVVNNYGVVNNYDMRTFNIFTNKNASEAVENFIKKPLDTPDIDTLIISANSDTSASKIAFIDKTESYSFVPVDVHQPLREWESEMGLIIESPVFKDGNKWKFYDGSSSFFAEILDKEFLKAVDDGRERFGKGDSLIAKVKCSQTAMLNDMKIVKQIIKVIEHKEAARQSILFNEK